MKDNSKPLNIEAYKSYDSYSEYTKALRTWLVAYGLGGPLLFISKPEIAKQIALDPNKATIVYLFLAGLALQVAMAFLNKWTNWASYSVALNPPKELHIYHKVIIWFANQFWIDILVDLVSSASFIWATFLVLGIMMK